MEYKTLPQKSFLLTCPVTTIIKNIFISYVLSFITLLVFSFVITYTNIPFSVITPVTITITLLSIFITSMSNGKKSNEKGWLTGCTTGFLYMLILYIIGCIIYKNASISSNGIIMIILGILTGTIGSIIGINNKKRKF